MTEVPRLARIQVIRERMEEIERAVANFRDALRESNDPIHQTVFPPVLDRIVAIVRNERDGITTAIADDLAAARSALRRLPISDIDPELDAPTRARKALRGERGNLAEALDNALEAVRDIGLEPTHADFGELQVNRQPYASELIRLDERLRAVQESLDELRAASDSAAEQGGEIVGPHARALEVEVRAARFETAVSPEMDGALKTDLAALVRAVSAMRDIATDLRETVDGLGGLVAEGVRNAGRAVGRAAERSWRGVRTVVSIVKRRVGVRRAEQPPPDFSLEAVTQMILRGGIEPPEHWRPFVKTLEFREAGTIDLRPLAGLVNLEFLLVSGADVTGMSALSNLERLATLRLFDVSPDDPVPLSRLRALRELSLSQTEVKDLRPVSGLTHLETLVLAYTPVTDIGPLAGLSSLTKLSLSGTQIEDFSPLAALTALTTLYLNSTNISDLRPLSDLHRLKLLDLNATNIVDLWPLANLQELEELSLSRTAIYDVSALAGLRKLTTLVLDKTDIVDLSPLAALPNLTSISVDGERRRRRLAPTLGSRAGLLSNSQI